MYIYTKKIFATLFPFKGFKFFDAKPIAVFAGFSLSFFNKNIDMSLFAIF